MGPTLFGQAALARAVATTTVTMDDLLAELRRRHSQRLPKDAAYETMMYRAATPPTKRSLEALATYIQSERRDRTATPDLANDLDHAAIGHTLSSMQWPDATPLGRLGALMPGWDTLHVTTLMHSIIPDYPIMGQDERTGLARLGIQVAAAEDPRHPDAPDTYATYVDHVKEIREAARFDQVPESHHYLTRIVQAALEDLGADHA